MMNKKKKQKLKLSGAKHRINNKQKNSFKLKKVKKKVLYFL